jgi:hypothetical protein
MVTVCRGCSGIVLLSSRSPTRLGQEYFWCPGHIKVGNSQRNAVLRTLRKYRVTRNCSLPRVRRVQDDSIWSDSINHVYSDQPALSDMVMPFSETSDSRITGFIRDKLTATEGGIFHCRPPKPSITVPEIKALKLGHLTALDPWDAGHE